MIVVISCYWVVLLRKVVLLRCFAFIPDVRVQYLCVSRLSHLRLSARCAVALIVFGMNLLTSQASRGRELVPDAITYAC